MDNPDNSLKSDIGEELDWDPMLDDSQIVVNVQDGRVTLSGAVPTYYEVNLAEQDARSVRGVKAVDNDLLVGPIGESARRPRTSPPGPRLPWTPTGSSQTAPSAWT